MVMDFYKKYGQLIGYSILLAFAVYVYKYFKDLGGQILNLNLVIAAFIISVLGMVIFIITTNDKKFNINEEEGIIKRVDKI